MNLNIFLFIISIFIINNLIIKKHDQIIGGYRKNKITNHQYERSPTQYKIKQTKIPKYVKRNSKIENKRSILNK